MTSTQSSSPSPQGSSSASPLPIVSCSPHVHEGSSVRRIMLDVVLALVPAMAAALFFFGWNAARLLIVCVSACVLGEAAARACMRRDLGIADVSAVVTGILLAFNLPPTLPTWMAILGSLVAIVIAKQIFGGIGYNPFNPALVGRAFLLISFPVHMTTWTPWAAPAPAPGVDAVTTATPLGRLKTALQAPLDLDTSGLESGSAPAAEAAEVLARDLRLRGRMVPRAGGALRLEGSCKAAPGEISVRYRLVRSSDSRVLAEGTASGPEARQVARAVSNSILRAAKVPFRFDRPTAWSFFLGRKNGCLGEGSGLALLLGAGYLLARRVIDWRLPVAFLGTVGVLAGCLWWMDPILNQPPLFHWLTGGLLLGALFMATDMVTSPVTRSGRLMFGAGCGLLTLIIRQWGGYPEGVSFAILIMNSLTPLINRLTRPRVFGQARRGGGKTP